MIRLGVVAALLVTIFAGAHPAAPPRELRALVTRLVREAETSKREGRLVRDEASVSGEVSPRPEDAALLAAISQRLHRDPFVDAYVRWQLTSFGSDLERLDDAAFVRLVRSIPARPANPRADGEVVRDLARFDASGALRDRERRKLDRVIETLEREAARAAALDRPATSFHAWVQQRLPARGVRTPLWRLARIQVAGAAGWSDRRLKGELTSDLTSAGPLLPRDQAGLLASAEQLTDRRRPVVAEITHLASGAIRVRFETTGVNRDNIRTWKRRLKG